jgi:hypothetical protein
MMQTITQQLEAAMFTTAEFAAAMARTEAAQNALLRLVNECDALRAFEADIRAIVGNTNWSVLRLRVDEARAVLNPTS